MNQDPTHTPNPSVGEAVQEIRTAVSHTARAVAHEAEQGKELALSKYQQAREVALSKLEAVKAKAAAQAGVVKAKASEGWNQACGKAKDVTEAGEEYVKENPGKSVLIALSVGVAIGWLLNNRR